MSGIAGVISAPDRPVNLSHFWNSLQTLSRGDLSRSASCEWHPQTGLRQLDLGRRPVDPQSTSQAVVGFCCDQETPAGPEQRSPDIYVAHDCELLNRTELAGELGLPGNASCSRVLSAGLEKWGPGLFGRLQGAFAIAAIQAASGSLLLARDRLGLRPLFYHWDPQTGLCFASQIGSLLTLGQLSRQINPAPLWNYLTTVDLSASEETIFRGIKEVPSGSVLRIPSDASRAPAASPFGRFPIEEPGGSVSEAGSRLRELLFGSVLRGFSGCGQLGITLSGGLDSSAVAASAAHLRVPSTELHAFTFAPETNGREYSWNEEPRARSVAQSLGIRLHSVPLSASQIIADFEGLIRAQAFPFSSPVLFANLQLLRTASERGIDLVLNGHGPDILFAGGTSHINARVAGMMRRMRLRTAWKTLRTVHQHDGQGPVRTLRVAAGLCLPSVKRALRPGAGRAESSSLIQHSWFQDRLAPEELAGDQVDLDLRSLRLSELTRSVLPRFVRYEYGTSIMARVRNASPFLADEIVDFAMALPEDCLISGDGLTKVALRQAMRGLLPEEVLASRRRVGFPVPAEQWLLDSAAWARKYLLQASGWPFLDGAALRRRADDFFERRSAASWDGALALWKVILLTAWIEAFDLRLP